MNSRKPRVDDPVEAVIAAALDVARIAYTCERHDGQSVDFVLPTGTVIECKRFHTPRTDKQLRAHADIILVQGMGAAMTFASLLTRQKEEAL